MLWPGDVTHMTPLHLVMAAIPGEKLQPPFVGSDSQKGLNYKFPVNGGYAGVRHRPLDHARRYESEIGHSSAQTGTRDPESDLHALVPRVPSRQVRDAPIHGTLVGVACGEAVNHGGPDAVGLPIDVDVLPTTITGMPSPGNPAPVVVGEPEVYLLVEPPP